MDNSELCELYMAEITIELPKAEALSEGFIRKLMERLESETAGTKTRPHVKLILR